MCQTPRYPQTYSHTRLNRSEAVLISHSVYFSIARVLSFSGKETVVKQAVWLNMSEYSANCTRRTVFVFFLLPGDENVLHVISSHTCHDYLSISKQFIPSK